MSCCIFFVKDNDLVGVGFGKIDIVPNYADVPSEIYDAFHQAVEYFASDFDIDPKTHALLHDRYSYAFKDRNALFAYQYVAIPAHNLVVGRQLVHDLLQSKVSSAQFAEMVKTKTSEFNLDPHHWHGLYTWATINERRNQLNPNAVAYKQASLQLIREAIAWREEFEPEQCLDVNRPAHQAHYTWLVEWGRGHFPPIHSMIVLAEIFGKDSLYS